MQQVQLKRSVKFDTKSFNPELRTIAIAISSQEPYLRSFGYEVLEHSVNALDTTRLAAPAPLLWQHDLNDIRGVLESFELGADGVLRGTVRFSTLPEGEKLMTLVKEGCVGQVSVGYMVESMIQTGEKDGYPVFTVNRWVPYEVSFVTVAADPTVGVGRTNDLDAMVTRAIDNYKKTITVTVTVDDDCAEDSAETSAETDTAQVEMNTDPELERITTLKTLGNVFNAEDVAEKIISEGGTSEDFKKALEAPTIIIKKENNKMDYNLQQAFKNLHSGSSDNLEAKTSQDLSSQLGIKTKGILIPTSALTRTQTVGVAASGGNLVQPQYLDNQFMNPIHDAYIVDQLGITQVSLNTKTVIAKANGDNVFVWGTAGAGNTRASRETAALEKKSYSTGYIELNPIRGGTYIEFSDQLEMEVTPAFVSMMKSDLMQTVDMEKQRVLFSGNGVNEPSGLNTRAIQTVTGAGAIPTRAELLSMKSKIAGVNGIPGKFLMSATMAYTLMNVAVGTAGKFLLEDNYMLLGTPVVISNQIPDNEIWCAEWNNVIWADFGAIGIEIVRDADLALHGLNRYQISLFADTNVKREERIVKGVFA